ncbi:SusC/RagA family TonB-linked outer membrane protein [Parafilimonas terrae]|uniref:TonB-linked outer membrane protein, SusC/RagA family n=1 Tax=Parafilimonas terrae TaxID=1465490 RepID=A0A1I5SVV7_9BACT|nr:SusC/RagA family TonB-linked outer membrane protein [Parafilimonas terrae]SFP74617.1 TonB-linked outer membrane protein, SusC/RagA family [Parafilimonas terrae]
MKNEPSCRNAGVGRKLLVFSLFFLLAFSVRSQTVTGKVTDEDGKPLQAVSVLVKNTKTGTATDSSGNYSIKAGPNVTLVFSSVGFVSIELNVGNRSVVDAVLPANTQNLGDVVVTALGIKRSERGLGYSTTIVKPDELTVNRTSNPMNALQGKVAGVNISSLGTGPGGTSKIRIRGQSAITGGGSPLIVINGVPIDNSSFNGNTVGVSGGGVYADGGDGLGSINPDDIESMTVLKGAPAAALYGNRAANGVIMITTKTKGKNRGIGVTLNSNYTFETPLDFTDYQNQYGQGENGVRPTTPNPTSGEWSFGEKIEPGMTQILFDNLTVPYVAQGSRIKEFYRTGQNFANTVTLESMGEKGGVHLSLNNTENLGITPNNKFGRYIVNLGFNYDLSDKFSFAGNVNYSNERIKNPPNIANQDNSIPTTLMALANTMPLKVLEENKYNADGNEYVFSRFTNRTNPYWVLAEQFHNIKRDRVFGNISLKYNILPWWWVQGRVGMDYYSRDEDVNNFPTGIASRAPAQAGFVNGVYTQEARRNRETNLDFLTVANKSFGDFDITLTAGGNNRRNRLDINNVQVTDFVVRGLYTVQNGRAKNPVYTLSQFGVNSLYGSGEIGWKKTLYLNGTIRKDWFSTLSKENMGIIYPSVSGSYVFSESLGKAAPWLTFGKLRVGYAEVGSDGDVGPYADQLFYTVNSNTILNPSGTAVTVGTSGSTLPNPNLRPMRVKEFEAGMELRMFNNRVGLDVAVYKKTTIDQIFSVQISDASGFLNTRINSGESYNKGFEGLLNITPVLTNNFRWDFTANTSYNITKVISISTNTPGERATIGSHPFNGEVRVVVGEEMGQIAGYGYARNDNGQMIFQSNGLPLRTDDFVLFGSGLPKWTGGFFNSFNYKGVYLTVLIDYKLGNTMLSGTNFNAVRHGLHKMTLEGRETGYVVGDGVSQDGQKNTAQAAVQTYWEHLRTQQIVEPVVYNAGFWKIRQVSLGYDFTKKLPANWPIKGLKLDFVANNVLILKKWVDNIDPETVGYGVDNMIGLESPGVPSTRSMGVNLNIKF